MTLQWEETLTTGIDEIDAQHKSIIEQLTRLTDAVADDHAKEQLSGISAFLVDHAQHHFAAEERYMREYAYPKIEEQRREHAEFTRDIMELSRRFKTEGASRELALVTTGKLVRWVITHVRNHDRELGEYIREHGGQLEPDPTTAPQ